MKRGGFARRAAGAASDHQTDRAQRLQARAARALAEAVPRASSLMCPAQAPAPMPKTTLVRSELYRRAVAGLPCMWCGIHGSSQHAHLNLGKGSGLKTDDRTGFPLCADRPGVEGCHVAYDQYRLVPGGREGHRVYGLEWGRITRAEILSLGLWPINLPAWQESTSST
ncbi:hypothetical protein [Comamonas antarctica]|uniref:hypothetical protein n=1 Tax=Comamonas antarctica TaxID=2743470 RepID=UPI0028EC375D|nr:hypothetical protein [Comamonas antarctica]